MKTKNHTPWPDSGKPLEAFCSEIRHAGRLVGTWDQVREIVHRCNAYTALLAAMELIASSVDQPGHVAYTTKVRMIEIAQAAIAKVKGE